MQAICPMYDYEAITRLSMKIGLVVCNPNNNWHITIEFTDVYFSPKESR